MNNIEEILKNIDFDGNKLVKVNKNLYLTNNQISLLKRYEIDYESSNSIRDLMIKIEDYLDYDESDELEDLLSCLSERNYYENTNK